jgi:ABC-2 type transport system permease protein
MLFAQLKNELLKLFGKKRTYIGFGAFVLAQTVMLLAFKFTRWESDMGRMLSNNGYLPVDFISALTVSVVMLMPQIILLMPLYVALVGGDLVAKEYEDGTLRMILSRPISRVRLLLVKWLSGIIFAALLVTALGATALGLASLFFPWKGLFVFVPGQAFSVLPADQGLARFAFAHVFLAVNASAMLSVAFMFSCFNVKPAAATIVALSYLFINVVMESIPFFDRYENWFITHHFKCWLQVFQNPIPWSQILQSESVLLGACATSFVVGSVVFYTRDIKS